MSGKVKSVATMLGGVSLPVEVPIYLVPTDDENVESILEILRDHEFQIASFAAFDGPSKRLTATLGWQFVVRLVKSQDVREIYRGPSLHKALEVYNNLGDLEEK